ncbi:putative 3-oxo-5-alpha-steroid 4-dehydrogenase [Trichodelitschia bisporula]|uniref:Polyprenal reductase n=1 Tax=Trichodelitschia bisporula TaxID=703511 RepID=A0A6G1I6G9_9PEZI|nr:putative 3-oxo-5-alpha-steroid 4-dehydrogenase [Trichodelitschia bisporula]
MDALYDPILLTRAFFILASATILLIASIPALHTRFVVYGARQHDVDSSRDKSISFGETSGDKTTETSAIDTFLDHLATYRVPHAWFTHFYLFSLVNSGFWLWQLYTEGAAIRFIAAYVALPPASAMYKEQALLAELLILFTSLRRIYECMVLAKPSTSRMWCLHWILGMAFYAILPVAIWLEAIPFIQHPDPWSPTFLLRLTSCTALFLLASRAQHAVHKHLYALPPGPNYVLPTHPYLAHTLTPHYLAECAEYAALALLTAPRDAWINRTMLAAAVFVCVNLGVTAKGTKEWYVRRFGKRVKGRARMVPYVW